MLDSMLSYEYVAHKFLLTWKKFPSPCSFLILSMVRMSDLMCLSRICLLAFRETPTMRCEVLLDLCLARTGRIQCSTSLSMLSLVTVYVSLQYMISNPLAESICGCSGMLTES